MLLDGGPIAAVLTRGAAGAMAKHWRRHRLPRERLADLDALTAATRFACLVAARTCAQAGASPPRLAELPEPVY